MLHRVIVVVLVLFFLTAALAAQQTAFVVDADGKAIATVNLDDGSVTTKIPLPFTPDRTRVAPDGKTLLVLDQGEGTRGFWVAEFRPKTKANAAIIRDGKMIASTELGWGLAESAFSSDGRSAYVLTTGYESNKEPERKASELVRISLTDGTVTGRIPLDAAAEAFAADDASTTGIIYSPPYPKKSPKPLPARLTFVDLTTFEAKERIEIIGQDVKRPVAAGGLLYIADAGTKTLRGRITVVDPQKRAVVEKIDVGPEALISGSDKDDRLFVLSQGADKDSGALRILKRNTKSRRLRKWRACRTTASARSSWAGRNSPSSTSRPAPSAQRWSKPAIPSPCSAPRTADARSSSTWTAINAAA